MRVEGEFAINIILDRFAIDREYSGPNPLDDELDKEKESLIVSWCGMRNGEKNLETNFIIGQDYGQRNVEMGLKTERKM